MRIISDFHDYYDCIQRYGQDSTVVYLRKEKSIIGWPFPLCNSHFGDSLHTETIVIGFCGKITPVLELITYDGLRKGLFWNIEHVDTYMRQHLKKRAFECYMKSKWYRGTFYSRHRKGFQRFFSLCTQQADEYEYLFRDNHSPLFVATKRSFKKGEIIFNTPLKNVEFYSIIDTYEAFQEISMYMGGILGTHGGHKTKYKGKPMSSNVSDKDLIVAKGFDKHSFRNSK